MRRPRLPNSAPADLVTQMQGLTYQARRSRKGKSVPAVRFSRRGSGHGIVEDAGCLEKRSVKAGDDWRETPDPPREADILKKYCSNNSEGEILYLHFAQAQKYGLILGRHLSKISLRPGDFQKSAGLEAGWSRYWQKPSFEVIQRRAKLEPARRRAVALLTAVQRNARESPAHAN